MTAIPSIDLGFGGPSASDGFADSGSADDILNDLYARVDAATSSGDMALSTGDVDLGGPVTIEQEDDFFAEAMSASAAMQASMPNTGDDDLDQLMAEAAALRAASGKEKQASGGSVLIPLAIGGVLIAGAWYLWKRGRSNA